MRPSHLVTPLVLIASCGDSTGPGSGSSARVVDPSGDTYGNGGVDWDIIAMSIASDTGGITLRLDFSSPLISPMSGDSNALIGFIEFDTDEDSTTGFLPTVDQVRRTAGSTGMGAEYQLDLWNYLPDSTATVISASGSPMGEVRPVFQGKRLTVRIPLAMLGGDASFYASGAFGTVAAPSDIIPENGHLQLGVQGLTGASRTGGLRAESGTRRMLSAPPWWVTAAAAPHAPRVAWTPTSSGRADRAWGERVEAG